LEIKKKKRENKKIKNKLKAQKELKRDPRLYF
jgi:hypothetical protein